MQLINYVKENQLLSPFQYGFLSPFQYGFRRHCSKHVVIKFARDLREQMDKTQLREALFMLFHKAFNTVNHATLLYKLLFYGILENELFWLSSYLFARSQIVVYKGTV